MFIIYLFMSKKSQNKTKSKSKIEGYCHITFTGHSYANVIQTRHNRQLNIQEFPLDCNGISYLMAPICASGEISEAELYDFIIRFIEFDCNDRWSIFNETSQKGFIDLVNETWKACRGVEPISQIRVYERLSNMYKLLGITKDISECGSPEDGCKVYLNQYIDKDYFGGTLNDSGETQGEGGIVIGCNNLGIRQGFYDMDSPFLRQIVSIIILPNGKQMKILNSTKLYHFLGKDRKVTFYIFDALCNVMLDKEIFRPEQFSRMKLERIDSYNAYVCTADSIADNELTIYSKRNINIFDRITFFCKKLFSAGKVLKKTKTVGKENTKSNTYKKRIFKRRTYKKRL